jgi:hypothetical protein
MWNSIWSGISNAASSVANTVSSWFGGGGNQSANALQGTYTGAPLNSGTANYSSPGRTYGPTNPYPNAQTISASSGVPSYGTPSSGLSGTAYGPSLPVTYNAGAQSTSGGGYSGSNNYGGFGNVSYGPVAPTTISASSLGMKGMAGTSSTQMGAGGAQPIVLGSTPYSAGANRVDTTGLAGNMAGIYNRNNADGTFTPVVDRQNETDLQTAKRYKDIFDGLGVKPTVAEDPEVIAARRDRQRIQQALLAPTSELNAVIAKQNQDLLQLRQTGSQEGVTEAVYGWQSSAINYNAAIRALPLQASISSLQGDLKLAQDYLTELTQIKQEQINNQYEFNSKLIAAILPALDKKDQRAYDEIKTANERAYNLHRDNIKAQDDWQQLAASSGQGGLIKSIASLNPTDPNFRKKLGEITAGIGGSLTGESSMLTAYAQQYASTGVIPSGIPKGSFGTIAGIAKELPKAEGQILDRATGITPDKLGAAGDAYGALYSAMKLSRDLAELDKKRVGGLVAGTLGKIFGASDQQRYVDLRSQIVDLLSRARSGAALTVTEEARYNDMLPGRFSNPLFLGANTQTRISNFSNALTSDLINKTNSKGWAINGLTPIKLGNNTYTVGDIIEVGGARGRINPDGSITQI